MKKLFILGLMLSASAAAARPVSYPEGWTVMENHMNDMTSLLVHYTTDKDNAFGYYGEYREDEKWQFHGAAWNHILRRWNMPQSQANIYLKSGAGVTYSDHENFDRKTEPSAFTGISMDWEDRRYFTMYENKAFYGGDIEKFYEQSVMVGVAHYIGEYGDIHTWLMLHLEHKPKENDEIIITPMVRLFKGDFLTEVGISDNGDPAFNFILRF